MKNFKQILEAIEKLDKEEEIDGKIYKYIDSEIGELLPADEVDPNTMQRYEKRANAKPARKRDLDMDYDFEDDLEASHQVKSIEDEMPNVNYGEIVSIIMDRASDRGGDPVDYLLNKHRDPFHKHIPQLTMDQINHIAQANGYEDVYAMIDDINSDNYPTTAESTDLSRILKLSGVNKK